MAIVLPVSCSAFYMPAQITDDNFNFVDCKDHGSCRESEKSRETCRQLEYGHVSMQVNEYCKNNTNDSYAAEFNAGQTIADLDGERKSEPHCNTENELNTQCKTPSLTDDRRGGELAYTPTAAGVKPSDDQEQLDAEERKMIKDSTTRSAMAHKRKLEFGELRIPDEPPRKISMRDNTPKQRRDEKKRILRMSVQKLKRMDDPENVLHRAVLINNTMRKMQKEIKEEKRRLIYGESIENITFSPRVRRDCEYERDVLCDNQNITALPIYDNCYDFCDFRHCSDRLADDGGYSLPIFPGLQIDAGKTDSSCRAEALLEKPLLTETDCVFNNLITALSET